MDLQVLDYKSGIKMYAVKALESLKIHDVHLG